MYAILFQHQISVAKFLSILPQLFQTSNFTTPSDQTLPPAHPFFQIIYEHNEEHKVQRSHEGDHWPHVESRERSSFRESASISFLENIQNSTELGVTWLHMNIIPALSSNLQPRELQRSLSNLYYSIILWLVSNATFTQSTQRVIKTSHYYFVLCPCDGSYLSVSQPLQHATVKRFTRESWYFYFKSRSQWD